MLYYTLYVYILFMHRYGVELAYALLTTCFFVHNVKRTGGDPTSLLFENRDTSTSCPETFGLSFQANTCQLQQEKDPMQRQPVDFQKNSFEDILACFEVSFKKLNKSKVQSITRIHTRI